MSEIDTRELCRRLSVQRSRIVERIRELEAAADSLRDNPSRDATEHPLRQLGAILTEYGELCIRGHRMQEQYEMLIAYEYQKRHGFPLLAEAAKNAPPGETIAAQRGGEE